MAGGLPHWEQPVCQTWIEYRPLLPQTITPHDTLAQSCSACRSPGQPWQILGYEVLDYDDISRIRSNEVR